MKVSPSISLNEMCAILRESLTEKFGCEVENLTITSYDKPKIQIEFGIAQDGGDHAMVDCSEFRHATNVVK